MAVFSYLMYGELDRESESFKRLLNIILSDECKLDVRDSLDEDYFAYDKNRIERMWARLIYLVCSLEAWGKEEPFKRHIDSSALCWRQIRSLCVENLLPKMVRYKRGQLGGDSEKEELKSALRHVLIKVYWLVTLLLFMSNRGGECPEVHLKNIGWVVDPERYFKFSMKQVLFSGTVVLTAILSGAFAGGFLLYEMQDRGLIPGDFEITPQHLFSWIVFGVPMFVVPLITALQFKRYLSVYKVWEVYKPRQPRVSLSQRPWDIYVLVAFVSYLATLVVLLVIAKIAPLPSGRSFEDVITPLAMYTLISPVTALYISYLLDSPERGWKRGFRFYLRNFLPAVMQGVTNVVIITFCVLYFSESRSFALVDLQADEKARLMLYSVTAFLIGVAINYSARVVLFLRDRRTAIRNETTRSWLTVFTGNIKRRAEAVRQSSNAIEIVADNDLKAVACVGDEIKFSSSNEAPAVGTISSLNDSRLTISYGA
jgi:membrane protease YdiL (CAAX protease family)